MSKHQLPLDRILFYAERGGEEERIMARELLAFRAEKHTPDYDSEECQDLLAAVAFYS